MVFVWCEVAWTQSFRAVQSSRYAACKLQRSLPPYLTSWISHSRGRKAQASAVLHSLSPHLIVPTFFCRHSLFSSQVSLSGVRFVCTTWSPNSTSLVQIQERVVWFLWHEPQHVVWSLRSSRTSCRQMIISQFNSQEAQIIAALLGIEPCGCKLTGQHFLNNFEPEELIYYTGLVF